MPLEEFHHFDCPYCASENSVLIDFTGGSRQNFVVDCETCCAPIMVRIKLSGDEILEINIRKENE